MFGSELNEAPPPPPQLPALHGRERLRQIATLLWSPCYRALFDLEYEVNSRACGGGGYTLQPSTYRARLHGERAENYDSRTRARKRDEMAIALHANNMQHWSPSFVARSVSYFNLTSSWIQTEESRQRRLASQPTTFEVLRMMRDCQPRPSWTRGKHVHFYVADQTYEWVGMQKRGRRKTVEKHDARGMPVKIEHHVYVS